jgi:MSHA biogenesis protein MshQ
MGAHCLVNAKQLATQANGGFLKDTTNGFDFIFTSDSGGTMTLAYEAKNHNLTTGAAELWVNVPSVSSSVDTTIYLFYGNPSVTTDQSNVSGTWDANFITVYHFDFLSGTNTTMNDSKGNLSFAPGDLMQAGTPGSAGEGTSTPNAIAGGAIHLDNFFQGGFSTGFKTYSGFPTGSNPRTIECWASTSGGGSSSDHRIALGWGSVGTGTGWTLDLYNNFPTTDLYWGGGMTNNAAFAGRLATGIGTGWQHIAVVLPSGGTTYNDNKTYINGATAANDINVSGATTINSTSTGLVLNCFGACSGNWYSANLIDSYLDECRISDIERSGNWLATEYNNISNPFTFWSSSTPGISGRTIIVN